MLSKEDKRKEEKQLFSQKEIINKKNSIKVLMPNKNKDFLSNKKKNSNDNNKIIRKCIIINLFTIMLINIFCQIKSDILINLFYLENSSKITLKIKGPGEHNIFGNQNGNNFTGIDYLKEVHINGEKQDSLDYKYYFEKEDNFVELIWDDNINNCNHMFRKCLCITEINLSNFDTSHVTTMRSMFSGCFSLTSIDFHNFNTELVSNMMDMFYNCTSLTSLDLSNFKIIQNTNVVELFCRCSNLRYINLNNIDESKLNSLNNMFKNVPDDVIICMKEINNQSKIYSQLNSNQKALINNVNKCSEDCDNNLLNPYEYNGECFADCVKGFLYDENNNKLNKCKCELDECMICPKEALDKGLCTQCNTNYYPKENNDLNTDGYIKCYQNPEGYYLDNNMYKQCYHTCKSCNIFGNSTNHNCLECNDNYPIEIMNKNSSNCYEKCNYYYYIDNENNYHCTQDSSCPKEFPKLNEDKKECIKNDFLNTITDLMIKEKNETKKKSRVEEIGYYNNIIKIIEDGFIENYGKLNLNKGEDEVIKTDKMIITLTTTENQKNNINQNVTIIDLGECEQSLRSYYNISRNEILYMKKTEVFLIGFTIDYTVNTLFFNDDTMHKIYQSKGKFDFESQILIIIYSALISMVLNTPLNYLSLSNDAIIAFKQYKSNIKTVMKKAKLLEKSIILTFLT